MEYKEYGHWSEDGKEYIITERKTPRRSPPRQGLCRPVGEILRLIHKIKNHPHRRVVFDF